MVKGVNIVPLSSDHFEQIILSGPSTYTKTVCASILPSGTNPTAWTTWETGMKFFPRAPLLFDSLYLATKHSPLSMSHEASEQRALVVPHCPLVKIKSLKCLSNVSNSGAPPLPSTSPPTASLVLKFLLSLHHWTCLLCAFPAIGLASLQLLIQASLSPTAPLEAVAQVSFSAARSTLWETPTPPLPPPSLTWNTDSCQPSVVRASSDN